MIGKIELLLQVISLILQLKGTDRVSLMILDLNVSFLADPHMIVRQSADLH